MNAIETKQGPAYRNIEPYMLSKSPSLRSTPRERIVEISHQYLAKVVTVIHVPFEIFHLPLGFIHFSAIQVDVFGQEYII